MLTRHLILVALCPHCVFNRAYGGISKVIEHKMPPEGMVDRAPEMVAGGTVVGVEEGEGEGRITAMTIMTIMRQITEVEAVVVAQGGKSLRPHPDVVDHPNRLLLGMMVKVLWDSSMDSWIIDRCFKLRLPSKPCRTSSPAFAHLAIWRFCCSTRSFYAERVPVLGSTTGMQMWHSCNSQDGDANMRSPR